MIQNKNHWYDGWFYDSFIAPNQDKLFADIKSLIESGSKVIDVGCGTGRLAFALADKCKSVLGIDLSKRNIDRAQLNLIQRPESKITFNHNNLAEIIQDGQANFDYAVLSYVIHEVDENERISLLNELAQLSDKILVADYLVPRPQSIGNFLSQIIEFIAGRDHYKNYKSYVANGGVHYLADKAGLKIVYTYQYYNNYIMILTK
jgi:SAM-dependent methyltransferase